MTTDMAPVIAPKSDQINADDLIGGPITITIESVSVKPGTEQPVSIAIDGLSKVFRPCKSMCRVMVAAWGPDSAVYAGRSLTLYRDPKVKWGGMEVGGIRISAMSHISTAMTMALTETKHSRKPFTVKPLAMAPDIKPAARQTERPAEPVDDMALTFWADEYEGKIDGAETYADLNAILKAETSTPEYAALKAADEARSTALRVKAQGRLKALKVAVSA
jgi:hypothetical protein